MKTISVWLTHKDVSCWNITEKQIGLLKEKLPGTEIIHCRNKNEFLSSLKKAETAVIWVFKQEWFEKSPNLKVIITPAAGKDLFHVIPPDTVHMEYSSFHGKIIGETVLAMMLCHCRGISYLMKDSSGWPRPELDKINRSLKGSRVTVLGFGSIGLEIAELCKKLGASVYGVKRTLSEPPSFFGSNDKIISAGDFKKILPETDHLVSALPGTEVTTDIINKEIFNLLPEHAAVYNVGRGNAINEDDLITALKTGEISGAYLDVFKTEPLPDDSPLRNCPGCFIMPHGSAIAPEYLNHFIEEFVQKFIIWSEKGIQADKQKHKDTVLKNDSKWKTF
jgi:D-2-hydroxyacid dehydrogenase (NADP+)